jgi:hypothetical protein
MQFTGISKHTHGTGWLPGLNHQPQFPVRNAFPSELLAGAQAHGLSQGCGNGNLPAFSQRGGTHALNLSCKNIMSITGKGKGKS